MNHLTVFTLFFNKKFLSFNLIILLNLAFLVPNSVANNQDELKFSSPPLIKLSQKDATRQALALNRFRMGLKSWTDIAPDLENAIKYASSWPQGDSSVVHKQISWAQVTNSLKLLKELLPRLDNEPELLAKNFTWYKLSPASHFTGYYSPVIQASHTKKADYTYPLYRLPDELAPELSACLANHSCPDTAFTKVIRPDPPFFTREEIDLDKKLSGQGLEIAWLKHAFDGYSLMLQGSGYLEFDDGTGRAILFAGLNGHRGESMAGYLMRTKNVAKRDATMEGMREWWDKNPEKRRAFLNATPGYVFFRYGAYEPQGTIGGNLTPWVSLAVDPRVLPLGGILAYYLPTKGKTKAGVITNKGKNNYLQGLGFASDTGGAIKRTRIDLYAGKGETGHTSAMSIYNKGQIWLLLKK